MKAVSKSNKSHGALRDGAGEPVLQMPTSVDLAFENHFSLFLIRPLTSSGVAWLEENVGDTETLTFGGAVVCEPRYVEAIYRGAVNEGLVCR